MADLNDFSAGPVVTSVIEFYGKRRTPAPARMDASAAGAACGRALWYGFRFAAQAAADGVALRRADMQSRAKERLLFELRGIGVEAYERNPEDGKPFEFTDAGGHLHAAMDACTHRVPSGGDQWHVTEFETLDGTEFATLTDRGMRTTRYAAFDKLQLIMGWSGMERALYMAETHDGGLFAERVPFDPVYFERLRARAESVIFAGEPPEKLHEDPTVDECRECPAHTSCHGTRVPPVSCRTCCYSTPERDGNALWTCSHPDESALRALDVDEQRRGCPNHVYMPHFINYAEAVEASPHGWILFRRRDNGRHFVVASATAMPPADMFTAYDSPAMYHSAELAAAADDRAIGNPDIEKLRAEFNGRVVG
jgi:hypothetical protein